MRNEIYARYGRPFVNKIYQDYFREKSWYQEKSNFSESWLSQTDRDNAELILSLEQSVRSIDETTALVLKNIEYTDGRAVLTFTSRTELIWVDRRVDFGAYGMSGHYEHSMPRLPWATGFWFMNLTLYNADMI